MEKPSPPGGSSADGDVSALLRAWSNGDQNAIQALTPIVYDELHRLARHYMHRERSGHSLQATALVNEAYMRLADYTVVNAEAVAERLTSAWAVGPDKMVVIGNGVDMRRFSPAPAPPRRLAGHVTVIGRFGCSRIATSCSFGSCVMHSPNLTSTRN